MTIQAVYFDFGGVISRTVNNTPRLRQAERLGIPVAQLVKAVFECESSRLASVGRISEQQHLESVVRSLGLPVEQATSFTDEFFSGDVLDQDLVNTIRGLHPARRTGLISNAWSGLRTWIVRQGIDNAFDHMVISAEVGVMKPDPGIYHLALEKLGVTAPEAVFVDDFIENVEGARALGMQAVHFTAVEPAMEELKKILSDHR
jgi:epoxide hydrolase-like predicted phosphatase